jgi:hypothetical protein
MDIFYEESAVNRNSKRGAKTYAIFNVVSKIFLILTFMMGMAAFLSIPDCSAQNLTPEQQEGLEMAKSWFGFCVIISLLFLSLFFYFNYVKSLCNVSYDYAFVTGELRIAKVFNVNKRKFIAKIDCNDILQIGRVDSSSFDRLSADPAVKQIVCTPNKETDAGKDFIYILAAQNGKKLFIIECRELMVGYMMKFVKHERE